MAVIVNGDGILTGISSLATSLTDITSGRGTITGVTTVGTLQLVAGVSISSPRTQTAAIFTNNTEFFTVDDAGRVGVGTITPNSDAHPENEKKINVGFITAKSIAGDIDARNVVVAGISTFTGAIDVNSTSNFGGNLTVSSGNLTMSGAGNIVLGDSASGTDDRITFGASTDLEIFHNGTNNHIDCHTAGQDLYIRPTKDVYFQDYVTDDKLIKMVKDGGIELYHNGSLRITTTSDGATFSGSALFPDNQRIKVGGDASNPDLQIYHDSNNTYMLNTTGNLILKDTTGSIYLQSSNIYIQDDTTNENIARFISDGACELYHDNGKRLETLDLGIDIGLNATGNFGIRWGGANYNYANIWTEYGSGDIFLAGGLKQKTTNGGFFSSYGGNFSRNAIQIDAFGNEGIHFYASAAQNVTKDDAITVPERVRINQYGLTFNGDSAAANALDDYEEGTFTPTQPTTGFNSASGNYTKIGRYVYANIFCTLPTNTSGVAFYIDSLPFTALNNSGTNIHGGYAIY